jgi:hypothetical protein
MRVVEESTSSMRIVDSVNAELSVRCHGDTRQGQSNGHDPVWCQCSWSCEAEGVTCNLTPPARDEPCKTEQLQRLTLAMVWCSKAWKGTAVP